MQTIKGVRELPLQRYVGTAHFLRCVQWESTHKAVFHVTAFMEKLERDARESEKKSKYEVDDPKRFLREVGGWRAGMGGGLYCTLLGNFRILDHVTVLPVHNEAGPAAQKGRSLRRL